MAGESPSWAVTLDAYEAGLDQLRRLLDSDEADLSPSTPWPPPALPTSALPSTMAGRAEALLRQSYELIDAIATRMNELPAPRNRRASGSLRSAVRDRSDGSRWTTTL